MPIGRRRVGIDPQSYALHLYGGRWEASCTAYGYLIAEAKRQDRCERKAQRVTCPICTRGKPPDAPSAHGGSRLMPHHPPDPPFIDLTGLSYQQREWLWQARRRRARRRLLALAALATVATIAIVATIRRWAA